MSRRGWRCGFWFTPPWGSADHATGHGRSRSGENYHLFLRRRNSHSSDRVGAVVVGGDFQGLGIVRSLGRHGVPVCIIDDELSISRFSRFATHAVRVGNLRDERQTVYAVLDIGRRLNLKGWVLYHTRDETVAAFSRYRSELMEWFRVPTPDWSAVQW